MSRATKHKHVEMENMRNHFSHLKDNQQIVKVLSSRGSNLHEVQAKDGSIFLASMPSKFRKNIWIRRGNFVLVESIKEGVKVKAEMVRILKAECIECFKKNGVWPSAFTEDKEEENLKEDWIVNTSRIQVDNYYSSTDSDSDFSESDANDSESV